jgi:hypothetical protein
MDSEGGGQRDPTPKTARERAQSPRRRARNGDAGVRGFEAAMMSGAGDDELPI